MGVIDEYEKKQWKRLNYHNSLGIFNSIYKWLSI